MDTFLYFWVPLCTFGYFFVTFWFVYVLLGTFGYFQVLLEPLVVLLSVFEYFLVLVGTFRYFLYYWVPLGRAWGVLWASWGILGASLGHLVGFLAASLWRPGIGHRRHGLNLGKLC